LHEWNILHPPADLVRFQRIISPGKWYSRPHRAFVRHKVSGSDQERGGMIVTAVKAAAITPYSKMVLNIDRRDPAPSKGTSPCPKALTYLSRLS
jgi:hypothetical protein